MKKLLIIAVCLFFMQITKSNAQVTDTLLYLQKIVARKNDFIGKPFSTLEKSLQIKIKKFNPHANITFDISKETSTFYSFIYPVVEETESYPHLIIYWKPYLDHKRAIQLFQKTNDGGAWTPEVDTFYSTGIISDIEAR